MANFLISILFFAVSSIAFAADKAGNGGDVIICKGPAGQVKSVELLDFYEARVLRGFKPDLGSLTVPVKEKLETAIARLRKVNPSRAAIYQNWAGDFEDQALLLANVTLPDIQDAGDLILPDGCEIEQIAIHRDPRFPHEKRYTLDKDLWDLLDNDNKAGLILHELIYRETADILPDSVPVRYFNSLIVSGAIETVSKLKLISIQRALYFQIVDEQGHPVKFCKASYVGAVCHLDENLNYYANGSIRWGDLIETRATLNNQSLKIFGITHFYENGAILSTGIRTWFTGFGSAWGMEFITPAGTFLAQDSDYTAFFDNGRLHKTRLVKDVSLKRADGTSRLCKVYHPVSSEYRNFPGAVYFDRQGYLKACNCFDFACSQQGE